MRKTAIALLALGLTVAGTAFASTDVRISQFYGGNGGQWNQDYVELFNASGVAVNIGGWTLQYGSATTTTGFATFTVYTFPAGTVIQPCGYFLLGLSVNTTAGTPLPVAPDLNSSAINLSASNGKLLLHTGAPAAIACLGNSLPHPASYKDQVGYGSGAGLCYETAAAPVLTNTTTALRGGGGLTDADNNSTDFTAAAAASTMPRNSSSPQNTECLATPVRSSTWGIIKLLYR